MLIIAAAPTKVRIRMSSYLSRKYEGQEKKGLKMKYFIRRDNQPGINSLLAALLGFDMLATWLFDP